MSEDRSLNVKDPIASVYAAPLASNSHLINAFTRQYEVLQSPPWLGNLLSKVTELFISGRETSVPGLCQLNHEQDQRESGEAGEQ